MSHFIIPPGFFSRRGRKSWLASISMVGILSLGFASAVVLAQNDQDAPPPPPPADQQSSPPDAGMAGHMGHHQMPSVDDQLKHLTKKLNLTAEQQDKLKPILEDQRAQMEKIHSDTSLSREDRFSKMQELRQNSDSQIKSVLTEEQQKNFDKMREEQRGRMGRWRKGGTPQAGGSPDPQ